MSLLEVNNIYAGYGKREVIKGISLFINSGEIVSIIGPNGAGKSTILKIIAGFLEPFRGKIFLNKKDITSLSPFKRAIAGISYLMQGGKIFPNLTVKENLDLSIGFNKNGEALEEVFWIFPEIQNWLKKRAGLMSGGEKQQLALAMILLRKPKVMLLDEPFSGIAPGLATEISKRIKEINSIIKAGIFLVEQNIKEALKISDRVYIILNGIIGSEYTTPSEFLIKATLDKFFLKTKNERAI